MGEGQQGPGEGQQGLGEGQQGLVLELLEYHSGDRGGFYGEQEQVYCWHYRRLALCIPAALRFLDMLSWLL